jgi:hypothetical protein
MDLNAVYRLRKPVVTHDFGSEVYVIPVRDTLADMTQIMGLNPTAARIWRGLEQGLTPEQLILGIRLECDAPVIEIRHEVVRFLNEIHEYFECDR